jgi:hypothetical protein
MAASVERKLGSVMPGSRTTTMATSLHGIAARAFRTRRGNPDRSVLLHRVAMRGRGQMPQLATFIVDDPAVRLIRDWITQLKPAKKPD